VTRVNVVLLLAVLATAFYLVNVRYESRRVYMAWSKSQVQALRLEADHDQVRVQQLAAGQLHMRSTNPAVTEYVQPKAVVPARVQQP
jgi:cell division protein FtsL